MVKSGFMLILYSHCPVGCPSIFKTHQKFTLIRDLIPFGILVRFLDFQNFRTIFTICQFMPKIHHNFSKMAIFGKKMIFLFLNFYSYSHILVFKSATPKHLYSSNVHFSFSWPILGVLVQAEWVCCP